MTKETPEKTPMHYVCTPEKARELVDSHQRFWVCNCGCREGRGACSRSRTDVCLMFEGDDFASGSGKREATRSEVEDILREAEEKRLVARPFRNEARDETEGICFCCDDCCGYFLNPEEKCDRGDLVARTDLDECTQCGACAEICYFKARTMTGEELKADESLCYGCGLCASVCPVECIKMVKRA